MSVTLEKEGHTVSSAARMERSDTSAMFAITIYVKIVLITSISVPTAGKKIRSRLASDLTEKHSGSILQINL